MRKLLYLLIALSLTLSPTVAFASGPEDPIPPQAYDVSLTPDTVSYLGGNVIITATVSGDFDPNSIYADVVLPGGGTGGTDEVWDLPMTSTDGTTYSATFAVPASPTPDQLLRYQVSVWGFDTFDNQFGANGGEIYQEAHGDDPPDVSDTQVSPRSLPSRGGAVSISALASDDHTVSEVHAQITLPDGDMTNVPLAHQSSGRYAGVFNAPANTTTSAQQYSVISVATDDIGQQDAEVAGTFSVATAPVPAPGVLVVQPKSIQFGAVRVGSTMRRSVLVSNQGARGAGSVTFAVQSPTSPFSLAGGTRTVTLKRGQSKLLSVGFKPSSVGAKSGVLGLQRTDGRQPGLSVGLSGKGVKPSKPR